MKLYAMSDLHVSHPRNRELVAQIPPRPRDWLLIAGDVGETPDHLEWTLTTLRSRFRQLVWAPGNHELWTLPTDPVQLAGEARYRYLVDLCRSLGVLTPEDPYPTVECDPGPVTVAPLFLLYDYSFRPPGSTRAEALEAALAAGVVCTDEFFLHAEPYVDAAEWCRHRLAVTAGRLEQLDPAYPVVLVTHFPLRRDLVHLPRIPLFSMWCGTEHTEDWHLRYRAAVVVTGHLHMPSVRWRDGVPFVEASLGYPAEWQRGAQRRLPQVVFPCPPR